MDESILDEDDDQLELGANGASSGQMTIVSNSLINNINSALESLRSSLRQEIVADVLHELHPRLQQLEDTNRELANTLTTLVPLVEKLAESDSSDEVLIMRR